VERFYETPAGKPARSNPPPIIGGQVSERFTRLRRAKIPIHAAPQTGDFRFAPTRYGDCARFCRFEFKQKDPLEPELVIFFYFYFYFQYVNVF
jgi:hypothetical protein